MAINGRVRQTPRKHELRRFWGALARLLRNLTLDRLSPVSAWVTTWSGDHIIQVKQRGVVFVWIEGAKRPLVMRAIGPGWPDDLALRLFGAFDDAPGWA
jgi:hypothetical protein